MPQLSTWNLDPTRLKAPLCHPHAKAGEEVQQRKQLLSCRISALTRALSDRVPLGRWQASLHVVPNVAATMPDRAKQFGK
jgi:hypothetical protein